MIRYSMDLPQHGSTKIRIPSELSEDNRDEDELFTPRCTLQKCTIKGQKQIKDNKMAVVYKKYLVLYHNETLQIGVKKIAIFSFISDDRM